MERCFECDCRCWYGYAMDARNFSCEGIWLTEFFGDIGPAHAVYFGTYEIVKDFAGGNADAGHHPLAAGE